MAPDVQYTLFPSNMNHLLKIAMKGINKEIKKLSK